MYSYTGHVSDLSRQALLPTCRLSSHQVRTYVHMPMHIFIDIYEYLFIHVYIHMSINMFICTYLYDYTMCFLISGGPIYVSDQPDKHNADIIRKLAFPDGSIPRCVRNARPVASSLFSDPQREVGVPLLLQNQNPAGGLVIGGFNIAGDWMTKTFFGRISLNTQCP
jgi:hypothetical protein